MATAKVRVRCGNTLERGDRARAACCKTKALLKPENRQVWPVRTCADAIGHRCLYTGEHRNTMDMQCFTEAVEHCRHYRANSESWPERKAHSHDCVVDLKKKHMSHDQSRHHYQAQQHSAGSVVIAEAFTLNSLFSCERAWTR